MSTDGGADNHDIGELPVKNAAAICSDRQALVCVDFLWKQDAALRNLGLERLSIRAGKVTVAMTVLPVMVNGLGITAAPKIPSSPSSAPIRASLAVLCSRQTGTIRERGV